MRTLTLIVGLLIGGTALADTVVRCRQTAPGVYPNTAKHVRTLDLISYVDHFSLSNMLAMKLDMEDGAATFTRESIRSERNTEMRFIARRSGKIQQGWLNIDRSPRQVVETRTFQGVLFLSSQRMDKADVPSQLGQNEVTTMNFECSF